MNTNYSSLTPKIPSKSGSILKSIFGLLFLLFGICNGFSQSPITYTTSGTWVCPQGVTSVQVEAWGGGAGARDAANTKGHVTGGGGGGAYARRNTITVVPGNSYSFTIGNGGASNTNGGNTTAIINGVTITAAGGSTGVASNTGTVNGGAGGTIAASVGDVRFSGGNGGSGLGNGGGPGSGSGGGGGSAAGSTGNGNNGGNATGTSAPGAGGATVATFGGAGGNGGNNANGVNATTNYGGGGGGAGDRSNGGTGFNGAMRFTFTCPALVSNAGPNQTLATCATTATLAGNTPTNATGAWTVVSGTGTVTTPTSPTSGVTGIVPGTPLVLRWTVSNGNCGSTFSDVTINSPVGPSCISFCTPTGNLNCTLNDFISNVTYNTLNNTSACSAGGYIVYPKAGAQTTSVLKGSTYTFSLTVGAGTGTHGAGVWIDFNQNGVFTDAGEFFLISNAIAASSTTTANITIPIGANAGDVRMRVRYAYNHTVASTDSCTMPGTYGETEDYTITLVDPAPCVAPTAQPTALVLTAQATIISGSFTAASPAPDNYLVVMSTSAVPPAGPVNGTTYTIGSTIAAGYTVVDNDSNTSFSVTGLTSLTTYYFYIYSFNSLCSGGPLYRIPSPLTGNITTGLVDYCIPTSTTSTRYIDDVSTTGYITNITNMTTGRAATGYADYTSIPPVTQIPGGGVTLDYRLAISRQFVKVWVDWNNDGTFTDAAPELVYTTGGVQTIAGSAGFVIPGATAPGNYRMRIRTFETSQTFGPCGNLATGEAEDYRLVVVADCTANISSVTDGSRCDAGTVTIGATGTAGTIQYRYYSARTGGTLVGTSATTSWTTPSISVNTSYYVTAWNGTCESWYRTEVKAKINPTTTINVTPSTPEVCGENNVVTIAALGDVVIDFLVDENFEGGGFGVLTRTNVAADANTQWTNRTSPYVPTGAVWKPAITSRTIGNRFALAVSDFAAPAPKDTQLRTVVLNTTAYSDLYLSFRHYFSYYVGEPLQFADVDVSTNGGGAWTNLASYTSTQGFAGQFNDVVINASAYAGLPSVMFRFRYQLQGSAWCDGWAIDDVKVYGTRPLNTTFSWSGGVQAFVDFACTIPYVAQSVSTIYVKPTAAQLEMPSYSFTASATLGNGCPVSKLISITNKSSVWKGSTNNDWNNPNNWSPVGVPTINTCVIIPDVTATNPSNILGANYNAFGKTLQVKNLGNLQIQPTNTLTIADYVDVTAGGTFNIENSGSLIQINNNVNTGNITMKRNTSIRRLDYVYWSTPVAGFASSAISPGTPTSFIYKWAPTTATAYASNFGNWLAGSESMVNGKGYIVRGPDSYTTTNALYTATFTGVPNNGNITTPITRSTYTGAPYAGPTATLVTADDDNWNLLGNPYPSAINAVDFLAANSANISGFVKIWTHGTLPVSAVDPFYQDFVVNYTTADYITYNNTGGTQFGFDGKIGAGQGFFVRMNDAASTSENVVFNNSMRSNTHRNDQFYRSGTEIERHRIWLDLISPSNTSSTTLVGYVSNATNNLDDEFDAIAQGVKTNFELYSLAESKELIIQGRSLPFNENDEVQLGVAIPQNGIYTIAISNVDGLFTNGDQDIYLEDKQLGVFHNLRTAPYTFTGTVGRNENRFNLLYNSSRLSQDDITLSNNLTVVSNENLTVFSSRETIDSIEVYDLLGKLVKTYSNVNTAEFMLNNLNKNNTTLLLKITLTNGSVINKKVIF